MHTYVLDENNVLDNYYEVVVHRFTIGIQQLLLFYLNLKSKIDVEGVFFVSK